MNYDLIVYSHIPYKPLKDFDYMQEKFTKKPFYARIKVPIVLIFYIGYLNLYYALLDFKTLVEICDFVTNEFATSCDYLTFTTTVGYIYNYCLHLKPLATTL
jgi:hypothetical protein